MCIQILGTSNQRYTYIGNIVIVLIKQAIPNTNFKKIRSD